MSEAAIRIFASLRDKDYFRAYDIGLEAIDGVASGREEIIAALQELTSRLRAECMDRAIQKSDGGNGYNELESLLRKASSLTGQDMYGKPHGSGGPFTDT